MKFIQELLLFLRKPVALMCSISISLVLVRSPLNIDKAFLLSAVNYIRVATTGTDTSACGGNASPCRTIQYAVNKAVPGDVITVAGGTYTYDPGNNHCTWAVTSAVVCFVDQNLTILGGYTISDWSTADPQNHVTIIDGENKVRGVIAVKYNAGATASLYMEGFTIQNGLSHGANTSYDYDARGFGGGMWSQKASLILRHMIFKNNSAIGADRDYSSGGYGVGGGLAVEADLNSNLPIIMDNVVFQNNRALGGVGTDRGGIAHGGGVFIYRAFLTASDLVIDNNLSQAGSSTGIGKDTIENLWADSLGGGIAMQIGSSANLTRITLTNNQAIGGNAGTAAGSQAGSGLGGAIYTEEAPVHLYDAVIRDNTAQGGVANVGGLAFGGGMNINYTTVTVDRTQIVDNLALSGGSSLGGSAGLVSGGGIYIASYASPGSGHLTLTNTVIADNAVQVGTPGTTSLTSGAGMGIQAVTVDIFHCTFDNNQFITEGKAGQAITVVGSGGPTGIAGVVNIWYTIFSNHVNSAWPNDTSALTVYATSSANLNYVMFSGNTNNTNINNKPVIHGTINQTNTMSPGTLGYVSPGSPIYNYHLTSSSPAINQAVNSSTPVDMDNQPRPYGPSSDIGADEYWPFSLVVVPGDGILHLDWTEGVFVLAGGVNHYEIIVTCEAGANPPQEGDCAQPINAGSATNFTLTGLTNFKSYTMTVNGFNSSDILIASSIIVTALPMGYLLYLPLVIK